MGIGDEVETALCALADHESETGNIPRAIKIYQELLKRVQADGTKPETSLMDAVDVSRLQARMPALYRQARRPDLASGWEVRHLEPWQSWDRKLLNHSISFC